MHRPIVGRLTMDLNQSLEFTPSSSSTSSEQNHNITPPMTSFLFPFHPPPKGDEEVNHRRVMMQKRSLQLFWNQQMRDINNITAFKSQHQLPLARIKKVMKSDKDVKMISADTPVLFSKACELFILELTLRSWLQTEEGKRRTLQRCDISKAIRQEESLHFLADAFPYLNPKSDDGKCHEENECHPANQLQFPLLDMNAELPPIGSPQIEPLMTKPPVSLDDFKLDQSAPK